MGFTTLEADPGLFIGHFKSGTKYLLVYVDDILGAAKSAANIQHVKDRLTKVFHDRDLGEAKYFLGMSLGRDRQARTLDDTGVPRHRASELLWKEGEQGQEHANEHLYQAGVSLFDKEFPKG